MPHPVTLVKADHRAVEKLFSEFSQAGDSAHDKKRDIADQIIKELAVHAKMEEKYLYPKLKEVLGEDHPDMVEEAVAEHHSAKVLLLEIKLLSSDNPQFDAKVTVLEEQIKHHVKEEEEDLLPLVDKLSDEEKETLGKDMEEYKEGLYATVLDKLLGEEE